VRWLDTPTTNAYSAKVSSITIEAAMIPLANGKSRQQAKMALGQLDVSLEPQQTEPILAILRTQDINFGSSSIRFSALAPRKTLCFGNFVHKRATESSPLSSSLLRQLSTPASILDTTSLKAPLVLSFKPLDSSLVVLEPRSQIGSSSRVGKQAVKPPSRGLGRIFQVLHISPIRLQRIVSIIEQVHCPEEQREV
jgi:hypothetical protein